MKQPTNLQPNIHDGQANMPTRLPTYEPQTFRPCLTPPILFTNTPQSYNQKHIKELVQQIRFKQRMDAINKKKGKYKRSTNNCHKKYIGILKNLLFLKLNNQKKDYILSQYNQYRNSRVYYFIILSYLKWYLDSMEIRWIFQHFCQEVEGKILRYRLEINTTKNSNFIRFRNDEIIEMEYSIQSINNFLRGNIEESIRVLYQKNKYIIIKRNQYLRTLQIISDLEGQLQNEMKDLRIAEKIGTLKLDEVYHWKKEISFNELESYERLSRRNHKEDTSNQELSQLSEDEEKELKNDHIQVNIGNQSRRAQHLVKMQDKSQEIPVKYPLMELEDSYQSISELSWYSWIIQKQKLLEFSIKHREEQQKKNFDVWNSEQNHSAIFMNPWKISMP